MLSLVTWNVRGIMSSSVCLSELFKYTNCDIAVLSEHKLFNHSLQFLNTLDNNYHSLGIADTSVNIETSKCGKGGVAIMYKKTLKFNIKPINCPVSERILGIEIQCNENYSIFVFSVYLPADSNIQNYKYEMNIVEDYVSNFSKFGPVIVAGDFNTSCRVTDLGRTNVNKSIVFSDFMLRNNIIPVNASTLRDASSFTYIPTRTLLDYFLVSEELAGDVISCENIPEGTLSLTSDHLPVFLKLSIPYVCNSTNSCNNVWPSWRKASESSLGAYNELTNKIADQLLDLPLCNLSDLDTLACKLTDKLKDCANETIPSGSFNPKTKPYWSDEVKQAHTAERLARRKWINQGRPRGANFPSYVEYKSAKNEFRNRQRFAYNAYMDNTYREIDEAAECDVRLFWRLISRQKNRKTNQISEILHHNRKCKSPEDISNAFADFYADVYTPTENSKFDNDFKVHVTEFVDRTLESCATNNGLLPGGEITLYEIETVVRNLKLRKAPGYDKLQNEHVRYSGKKLHTVILRIFNAVIRFGRIPLCWKHGLLIPLFKGYRTELDLVFNLGDKSVNISTETKHLGILRTVDLSPSTDIQHSCRKGRNAYFAIAGTGSCLLNPLTVCGLYNKIVIPAVLYGCELWNGIKPKDLRCLETFQHFIVKHIQGFPKRTRSDMCESMTNLERLPILVEKRKLMFLYKLCEMKAQSLTKQIFIYRLFQYFGDTSRKQHGFIPDVTKILSKYSLLNFLNSYMFTGCFPTKLQWKNIVNGAINQHEKHRKEERMRSDNDFTRFLRLSENNGYDFIWQYAKYTGRLRTAKHVAKLWSTPPTSGNCNLCGHFVQDTLYHQITMCTELQTQRHLLYKKIIRND
ncbi:unnamed protein product [Mytilus edulis]|uniref:Endonuclease/exonuclease/phosphatase domain-containing protein n=1 Tax=Mytilus edulis TaxID=6550 RepID=A0A8S3SI52_MYTED|nr:unnamed protein product [Mytilus edulis]